MAQVEDFRLIKQIVATGGHKHMTGEFDLDKYQHLVELGWLEAFRTSEPGVVLGNRTRPSRRLAFLTFHNPFKRGPASG